MLAQALTFLSQIAGDLSSPGISAAINFLTQLLTLADQEIIALQPEFKNVISTLSGNGAVTAQQLSDMETLAGQVDAAFDAAATAAGAPPPPAAS